MRAFSLLSQKGGAGKTTLAIHLAVHAAIRGVKVAIIDTDAQRSATDWWKARRLPQPAVATCQPKNLASALQSAKQRGFQLVIVDTPPRADDAAYLIAENVDFSLIPCRPNPYDLRAIGRTIDVLQQINAPAGIVLNAVPPSRGDVEAAMTRQARKVLRRYNVPVAPMALTDRPALAHPLPDGRTYIERFPDGRPAREFAALWNWVLRQMGVPEARARPAPADEAVARSDRRAATSVPAGPLPRPRLVRNTLRR